MVSVPDGASFDDVSVVCGPTTVLNNISIAPTQYELSYSNPDSIEYAPPNPEYYTLIDFPSDNCIYASTQDMRSYRFFCFIVSPFIYHPLDNQLQIVSRMTLSISYSLSDYRNLTRWDDGSFGDILRSIVENPNDVQTQTTRPPQLTDIKYLIITSNELVDNYQPLADWKTQKGIKTQIVTIESIQNNPQFLGTSLEERIKCCIQDYYENYGTQWVLLGGNTDIIPSRICYQDVPYETHTSGYNVQTDLYYACFDNNFQWDQNSNGIYGEVEDNIDLSPEIIIGRASIQNANVDIFVEKTISYEQTPPLTNFASKALMIGARIDSNITFGYYQGLSHTEWQMESAWTNYIAPYWNGVRHKFYDSTNNDYGQFTVNNLELAINTNSCIRIVGNGIGNIVIENLIYWDGTGWGQYIDTHNVVSPQGYKIKLLSHANSSLPLTTVELHHSGFLTPNNTPFWIYGSASNGGQTYENWIGYFDTESVWATDAFSSIWNDISMIKAKDWCLYRDPNSGIGALIGKMLPINCGDMVIITTVNDHQFQWNTTIPTDPKKKEVPTAFEYVEKADYTPVYIDLSAIDLSNLEEIGLKLDGICKGAVVVTDSLEQICAYLEDGESLSSGLVELVFFYESKSQPLEMRSVAINDTQLSSCIIGGDSAYPVYNIKVSNADLCNTVVPVLRLEQNYPNPFNPTTSIKYSIEELGTVSLDIYNIKGQLVKTLYYGNAEVGSHTATWNGLDDSGNACSSGVYFYRLRTPKTSLVRKMLMLK